MKIRLYLFKVTEKNIIGTYYVDTVYMDMGQFSKTQPTISWTQPTPKKQTASYTLTEL